MRRNGFALGGLVMCCLAFQLTGSASGQGSGGQLNALVALHQLQSDFHGAIALADEDLMHSLWAEDAVFHTPGGDFVGPDNITAFFVNGPRWGRVAGLSPSYKTTFDIDGNEATYYFECIFVEVDVEHGADPLTEVLASVPPGSQNPTVEIVQHSQGYGTAVRIGDRWVFEEFDVRPK